MQFDLDVTHRKVVVFGSVSGARRTVARFRTSGATVTFAVDGAVPEAADRLSTVRYVTRPEADDASALLRLIGPAWLVVTVGTDPALRTRIGSLAAHLRIMVVDEVPATLTGSVTLVGGGPGRTGLLTLEAVEALGAADVIFFDRLAPTDELARIAPAAELFDVGKSPYHHPVSQRSIEELMIARAQGGESVVRLKGGDPFVFGRGGEEMHACLAAGVPVRVVPGVSSSVAVPAACGIPVTHRGLSHCFTVISGHQRPDDRELEALARLGGTIVILMGIVNLDQIVAGLVGAGLDPATPAAVIERGFSDSQRSTFTTAGELGADARRLDISSPAVVVIGDVVSVAPQLGDTAQLLDAMPQWSAPLLADREPLADREALADQESMSEQQALSDQEARGA